jgi:hypothetical protein
MRWILATAVAASGLLTRPALADSQAIVDALQKEPATLWDLSLARLQAMIGADGVEHEYGGWVHYQDGEILILITSFTLPATEAACKSIVDRVKVRGEVDPETGWPNFPASAYASLFSYVRLDETAIDMTYMETVDSMFRIRVTLGVVGDGQAMTCTSKLLSKDVAYERQ